jgi:two-component system chemotaxis response regulator CheB
MFKGNQKMIKVMIVDDSATVRAGLSKIINKQQNMEVIAVAPDAYVARDKLAILNPDVICLDIEMPKLDGISFLKKIMQYKPIPVIMVSSLTQRGAQITMDALNAGAVDFVAKNDQFLSSLSNDFEKELILKIEKVSAIPVSKLKKTILNNSVKPTSVKNYNIKSTTQKIIAIGASTGGTMAIEELLSLFPANVPGIVITQHMPSGFTKMFAQTLNQKLNFDVKEAENGDIISNGKILIAPGEKQMKVLSNGGNYKVEINDDSKVSGHKPSVDYLFNSVAISAKENAIGIILTGMGSDGAKGLLKMKNSGSLTIGQDEKSSVIYGMPKIAFEMKAVQQQSALIDIPNIIKKHLNLK